MSEKTLVYLTLKDVGKHACLEEEREMRVFCFYLRQEVRLAHLGKGAYREGVTKVRGECSQQTSLGFWEDKTNVEHRRERKRCRAEAGRFIDLDVGH